MSWDDVIIGEGEKGCMATKVFDIDLRHDISENRVSYWISDGYLGSGMTIFKNTPEGKLLGERIAGRKAGKLDREGIDDWLEELAFKHMDNRKLRELVQKAVDKAYRAGSKARAAEIRAALGVA